MAHTEMPPVLDGISSEDKFTVVMTEVHSYSGEYTRAQLADLLSTAPDTVVQAILSDRVDDNDTWLVETMVTDAPHHRATRKFHVEAVKPYRPLEVKA